LAFTDLGEAKWLHEGPGAVCLTVTSTRIVRAPLPNAVPHMGSARVQGLSLTSEVIKEAQDVTISFAAGDRTPFGEKFKVALIP